MKKTNVLFFTGSLLLGLLFLVGPVSGGGKKSSKGESLAPTRERVTHYRPPSVSGQPGARTFGAPYRYPCTAGEAVIVKLPEKLRNGYVGTRWKVRFSAVGRKIGKMVLTYNGYKNVLFQGEPIFHPYTGKVEEEFYVPWGTTDIRLRTYGSGEASVYLVPK